MRSIIAWSRIAMFAFLATAAMGTGSKLAAQTTEGTVITNTATAAYTDANGNTYTNATGSVSVTVGFTAAITVSAGVANATPGAGSIGNTITFDITNPGNGNDSVSVNAVSDNASGAVITSYLLNGTPYADLTALNLALAAFQLDALAGTTATVTVIFDVPAAATVTDVANITLTATSRRDGGEVNSDVTTVTPGGVIVVADAATVSQLPSGTGPTRYQVTYQVTNQASVSADLDLLGSIDVTNDANVTIDSIAAGGVRHPAADTTVTFAAGETKTITITYSIGASGTLGDVSTITLTATASGLSGTPSDSDATVLTVLAPSLTVTKTVHASAANAAAGTPALAGDPVPGDQIWYRVFVDNSAGTAPADVTNMTDNFSALPLGYVAATLSETGSATVWATLAEAAGVITGTVTIPAGSSAFFIFAVTIN